MDQIIREYARKVKQAIKAYRLNHSQANYDSYIIARDNYKAVTSNG